MSSAIDQQSSSTNVALRDHLRIASRDVKRGIKNRWSGNGIGTATGESPTSATSYTTEEHQGLLSCAAEPPFESPMPHPRSNNRMVSVATSTDNPNINNPAMLDEFPLTVRTAYYSTNERNQNFDSSVISNYSSTANDASPPPSYHPSYHPTSQTSHMQPQPASGVSKMYVTTYGTQQTQNIMDTPSTSQLQRTINRTLLGGNESTMLSEQQQPGIIPSSIKETTIC